MCDSGVKSTASSGLFETSSISEITRRALGCVISPDLVPTARAGKEPPDERCTYHLDLSRGVNRLHQALHGGVVRVFLQGDDAGLQLRLWQTELIFRVGGMAAELQLKRAAVISAVEAVGRELAGAVKNKTRDAYQSVAVHAGVLQQLARRDGPWALLGREW